MCLISSNHMRRGVELEQTTSTFASASASHSRTYCTVDLHSLCDAASHTDLDWAVNEQWEDLLKKTQSFTFKHCRCAEVCVSVCETERWRQKMDVV